MYSTMGLAAIPWYTLGPWHLTDKLAIQGFGLMVAIGVVLAYQIVLMRTFAIESYASFGAMVISVALLGFGLSGTLLTVFRDGMFFIAAEVLLIIFLGDTMLTWWMGGGLMLLYVAYVGWVLRAQQQHGTGDAPDDDEEVEDDEDKTTLKALLTLDFRQLFFRDAPFSDRNAWMVLGASVTVISIACYGLSWSVVEIADVLDVPLYFTTVILAAAATSVPDTVLSVKDAMKGNYDDAVANALGSNIFDICVALGLPLMLYGLVFGNVRIAAEAGSSAGDVQELRVALLILSVLVMPVFLLGKRIDKKRAWVLLSLYGGWMLFIVVRAVQRSGMLG